MSGDFETIVTITQTSNGVRVSIMGMLVQFQHCGSG